MDATQGSLLNDKYEKFLEQLSQQVDNVLTLEDARGKIDEITEFLRVNNEYTTEDSGNALATLASLASMVSTSADVAEYAAIVKSLSEYLSIKGYGQIFVEIALKLQSQMLKNLQCTYNFYILCEGFRDFSYNCPALGRDFARFGGIEAMLQCINQLDNLSRESEGKLQDGHRQLSVETVILQSIIVIFYNCHRSFPDNRAIYRKANLVSIFESKLNSRDMKVRIFSVMLLANIADERLCERVTERLDCVLLVVELLNRAVDADDRYLKIVDDHAGTLFSSKEFIELLKQLAISDDNKEKIYQYGTEAIFFMMLDPDSSEDEKQLAVEVVWRLAFSERTKTQLISEDLLEVLASMMNSAHRGIKTASTYALWEFLELDHAVDLDQIQSDKIDVLISFQEDSVEQATMIRDKLAGKGFKVAMSANNVEEIELEKMATSVKKAAVVLLLATEKYKESCCCRSEASYASKLGKPIYALLVDSEYKPDGWLGKLVETTTSYTLSSDKETKANLKTLVKEIRKQCRIAGKIKDDEEAERLSPEEGKQMMEQAFEILNGCEDVSTKEVMEALNALHCIPYWMRSESKSQQPNHNFVAEYLAEQKYAKVFVKIAGGLQKMILDGDETSAKNILNCFTVLSGGFQNAADSCQQLCRDFGESGGVDIMLWFLTYWDNFPKDSDADICDLVIEAIQTIIGVLHNCIRLYRDNRMVYRKANVVEILRKMKTTNRVVQLDSTLTQAYIGGNKTNEELPQQEDIKMVNELLKEAIQSDNRVATIKPHENCYCALELLDGMNALADYDSNAIAIQNHGGIQVIVRVLQSNSCSDDEKQLAIKTLWKLVLAASVRKGKEFKDVVKASKALLSSSDKITREASEFVLWELDKANRGNPKTTSSPQPSLSNEILISCHSESHAGVVMIRDKLVNAGYNVMLTENEDREVTTMARAVEKSSLVLLCVTEKYKESSYCRSEISYAKKLGKPFIPLILEENCGLDGCLEEMTLGIQHPPCTLARASNEEMEANMHNVIVMIEDHLQENNSCFTPDTVGSDSVQQLTITSGADTEDNTSAGVRKYLGCFSVCFKRQ